MPECGKTITVVPVESILCSKPHESKRILVNAIDGILRQTVLDGQMVEFLFLTGDLDGHHGENPNRDNAFAQKY